MKLYNGRWSKPLKTLPLSLEIDFTVSFNGMQSPSNMRLINTLSKLLNGQASNLFQQRIAIILDQNCLKIENFINSLVGLENLNQTMQNQHSQRAERN